MAMSAAAPSAVSRDSSASYGSNRLGAYSLRSTTTWAPDAGASGQARAADRVPATPSATPWVRDAGFGLPVTTAMCMASGSGPHGLELGRDVIPPPVRPGMGCHDTAAGWAGPDVGANGVVLPGSSALPGAGCC